MYDYAMNSILAEREAWFGGLRPGGMRELFEHLPNTLYFAKDRELRLMAGNRAFTERCGYTRERDLIGHVDREIFPAELAAKYRADDRIVITTAKPLIGIVELFPDSLNEPEWFVTDKVPLFTLEGEVAGLCGTVRSYEGARAALQPYLDLLPVMDYLKTHYAENVSISNLAMHAGISMRHLQRRFQETFKTTPRDYIMKLRILNACDLLLKTNLTVTEIALQVGFYDHSVFSRMFSKVMGISPRAYRKEHPRP
ncbi:MAG: AraC-like DNA-binding protein [Verrucomicrobiales bacterium]